MQKVAPLAKVQRINIKVNKSAEIGNNSVSSTRSQSLPSTTMPSPSVQTVNTFTYTTMAAAAGNGTTQTSFVMSTPFTCISTFQPSISTGSTIMMPLSFQSQP